MAENRVPDRRRAARARNRPWRSRYILRRATSFLNRGLLDEAEIFLREATHREPGFAAAHAVRGLILLKTAQHISAIKSLSQAIALDATKSTVYYNRGLAYQRLGMRLLELNGKEVDDESMGLLQHAVDDYTAAVRLDKFCLQAYANRAGCYARMRKMRQAATSMNLAVQLIDPHSRLHFVHGKLGTSVAANKKFSAGNENVGRGGEGANMAEEGAKGGEGEMAKGGAAATAVQDDLAAFGIESMEKVSDFEQKRRERFGRLRRKSMSMEGSKELVQLLENRAQVMTKLGNTAAASQDGARAIEIANGNQHKNKNKKGKKKKKKGHDDE
jgi:tetratricopeptide (TPR) repeat protein